MQVSLLLLRSIHACLLGRGDAAAHFTAHLLERGLLSRGIYHQVDIARIEGAVQFATTLVDDPALVVRAGRDVLARALGVPGLLIAEAPTLRAAILDLQRCWPLLFSRGSCALIAEGELARLVLDLPTDARTAQRVSYELVLSFIVQLGPHVAQRTELLNYVALTHRAPDDLAPYADRFGRTLRFDAESTELAFPSAWLDIPRDFIDDVLRTELHVRAESMRQQLVQGKSMRDRVYALLMANPRISESDAQALAKLLGMSVAKMRSALQAEGETLLAIADEVRVVRARRLLSEGELAIKAISERLGYSRPSAFHRAFKRKTGLSPSDFRRLSAS